MGRIITGIVLGGLGGLLGTSSGFQTASGSTFGVPGEPIFILVGFAGLLGIASTFAIWWRPKPASYGLFGSALLGFVGLAEGLVEGLIAWIVPGALLAISGTLTWVSRDATRRRDLGPGAMRRECPHCRESIRAEASVCPHCQRESQPWAWEKGAWWTRDERGLAFRLDQKAGTWLPADGSTEK